MKIFIDSADVSALQECWNTGLIDGITTNPSLILKSGRHPHDVYNELKLMGCQDISMEITGTSTLEMMNQAHELLDLYSAEVTTIKVPMTKEGLAVTRELSRDGVRVNVTLIFCAAQALLAAKAGATYVSPFVGRLDDQSVAGLEVVRSISELYRIHRLPTQVLAASIRSVQRVVRSFYNGAEVVTMPPEIFWKMWDHILTDKGLDIFEADEAQRVSLL